MRKQIIAVSGKDGQLGSELQSLAKNNALYEFVFAGRDTLDLAKPETIIAFFEQHQPAYFINCAAYTAVDKAETEKKLAYKTNAEAVGVIAQQCKRCNAVLVHISTDYVFNGNGTKPYETDDATEPLNYYGYTKWMGEKLALEHHNNTIIIRTSWVYSKYGNNFVKTMMRLMKERSGINVVDDQTGSPTYAADLARAIISIITSQQKQNGIYHYSNEGVITWYQFAEAIKHLVQSNCKINPIPTSAFPTPAKRPHYSVMNTQKIKDTFNITILQWQQSLAACIKLMK